MFCPVCRSEYRPGFTQCAECEVPLVDHLEDTPATPSREVPSLAAAALVDYCGFLDFEEARRARRSLLEQGIPSEVVLRDAPDGTGEEYWLRVPASAVRRVAVLLGDLSEAPPESTAEDAPRDACGQCGHPAPAGESFCARCGSRLG